jgi:protein-tyrosine phosphatase
MTIGILFVCTGNICRSPMAAGVFRAMARRAGLAEAFRIDSAGTSIGHVGQPASRLAVEAAKRRGYDLSDHRARPLLNEDIARLDYPLAMDGNHLAALRWMAPRELVDRPRMFLAYVPDAHSLDVPDPFGGRVRDYEQALDLIEKGCAGLLTHIRPSVETARRGRARPADRGR